MQVPREAIVTTLVAIRDTGSESVGAAVALLEGAGYDHILASKLVTLVSLAFGRVFVAHIDEVSMSDGFYLGHGAGRVELPLRGEPIFVEAIQLAGEMMHGGPRDLLEAAIELSPEYRAANEALHQGMSLKGATLVTPTIFQLTADQWVER